jgi:hypothetical protein
MRWRLRSLGLLLLPLVLQACGSSSHTQPAAALELFASVGGNEIATGANGVVYVIGWKRNAAGGFSKALFRIGGSGDVFEMPVPIASSIALASDAAGNLYVSDNEACPAPICSSTPAFIRRLAPDGTTTRLPIVGSSDGSNFHITFIAGLAVDPAGNVYISGFNNIYRLKPDGDLTTLAGSENPLPHEEADGVGRNARFDGPTGLALDGAGNLYVADINGQTIRRVAPDGTVTTIAGIAFTGGSVDGPGRSATFNVPRRIAVDGSGNVYVLDPTDDLIRKIDSSGTVSTLAGTRGMRGFAPGPLPGTIDLPFALAVAGDNLFIAMDASVGVIRHLPH